jgi:WD40 repeat protein
MAVPRLAHPFAARALLGAHGAVLLLLVLASLSGRGARPAQAEEVPRKPASSRPELVLNVGHSAWIRQVAYSPDGKTLASYSEDGVVKLWDARTDELRRTMSGRGIDFQAGAGAFVRVMEGGVALHDPQTGASQRTLPIQPITEVFAASPDGTLLATVPRGDVWAYDPKKGKQPTAVKLWDLKTGALRFTLPGHEHLVRRAAFSPDGKLLATASFDHTVKLWDTQTGTLQRTLSGHPRPVWSLAFSPDGATLASADGMWGERTETRLWDVKTGELKRLIEEPLPAPSLHSHTDTIGHALAFSPDGRTLAKATGIWFVRLWDVESGRLRGKLEFPPEMPMWSLMAVAFSPNGKTLAGAGQGNQVCLWNVPSGTLRRMLGEQSIVGSLVFSPDGRTLASHGSDGQVRSWDPRQGELARVLTGPATRSSSLAWSRDGATLAVAAGSRVHLWDGRTGKERRTLPLPGTALTDHRLAISPDSRTLVGSESDGTLRIWDLETGELRKTLAEAAARFCCPVAFSPDGTLLASRGQGDAVRLRDTGTWTVRHSFPVDDRITALAFSPDGKTLAVGVGQPNGKVLLWNVETGRLRGAPLEPFSLINQLAFSPDGKNLAVAGNNPVVRVWLVAEAREIVALRGHRGWVRTVTFGPGGKSLWSGGTDGSIRVWDAGTGRLLANLLSLPPEREGEAATGWVAITPEGYYDGSPGCGRYIQWKLGEDYYPVEAYERTFHRPDLIQRALAGESLPQAPEVKRLAAGQAIPPQVMFLSPQEGQEVAGDAVEAEFLVTDDRKVAGLQLLVNGRPLPEDTKPIEVGAKPIQLGAKPIEVGAKPLPAGHKVAATYRVRVPLPPGETYVLLKAVATDDEGQQGWEQLRLTRKTSAAQGSLCVLAIGVAQYRNPRYNLRHAAADAEAFASLWPRTEGRLYRQVTITLLTDSQATTAGVRGALSRLLETARAGDTVALFLSGHGIQAREGEFYFATHDVDASSAARVAATALPWTVFQTTLAKTKAHRVLLFLDACHSGSSLGGQTAGNERLAEPLVKRGGALVFASSRGSQFSYELPEKGHGAFTTALLEGIGEGKADLGVKDGNITPLKLLLYLQQRVAELTGNRQTPVCPLLTDFGDGFTLARVGQDAG